MPCTGGAGSGGPGSAPGAALSGQQSTTLLAGTVELGSGAKAQFTSCLQALHHKQPHPVLKIDLESSDSKANEAAAARPKELEVEYLGEEDEDEEEEDEDEEEDDDDEERGQGKEGPSSQHRLSPRLHDIEEEDDEDHGRNTRERVQRRRHRSAFRRAPGIGRFSDEKGLLIESSGSYSAAPEQKQQQLQQRYSSIIARGMEKLFARAVYRHSYCTARSSEFRRSTLSLSHSTLCIIKLLSSDDAENSLHPNVT
uniref:Uncharacterized protein n=1 Tax=Trichogramma kaykai TaxID=54128 RepID=A0ABD2WBB7_9HYME